jgi:hypothetical protein
LKQKILYQSLKAKNHSKNASNDAQIFISYCRVNAVNKGTPLKNKDTIGSGELF